MKIGTASIDVPCIGTENATGVVGGNSKSDNIKVTNDLKMDIGFQLYDPVWKWMGFGKNLIDTAKDYDSLRPEYRIGTYSMDKIAFELMEAANIPIYGNDSKELEQRMRFVYDFIERNEGYFLETHYFSNFPNKLSHYEHDTYLINQLAKNNLNDHWTTVAHMRKIALRRIIDQLGDEFWGKWVEHPKGNWIYKDGYYQENVDPNYRRK